jgi:N-acetylglucosamine-6-phosphate deacetylase
VDLIHDPSLAETARILEYRDILRRVTVAPEIGGASEFIRACTAAGIVCSGGHSDATYEDVRRGVEAGMTHLTHHWSAMSSCRRVNAKRIAGMVEAGLVSDDLTTEVIADGRHLPTSLLRLAYKCKGAERLCLISDAMRGAGMPEGVYEVCGLPAVTRNGVAYTLDGQRLASSIIPMQTAVKHMILEAGIAPLDVLRMASLTPATVIGVADRKGSIAPGKDADILLIDPASFAVDEVILRGRRQRG